MWQEELPLLARRAWIYYKAVAKFLKMPKKEHKKTYIYFFEAKSAPLISDGI
jgi:hypothetical protein